MSIAANLATLFSFGDDVFGLLSASIPSRYSNEEIAVWRHVIDSVSLKIDNFLES